ncbi:MAG: phospholipid carrier-dependent glycosyltransferase [Bacteroidales bacterium]|nr:phospholipid carrier-dependent glycosyltransferase [Bacteroidales bacterium]
MKAEETLRFLPLSDGKQPFYMWVTIVFLKYISDPLIAGRLVSVFCGLGTFIGVAFLSYLLFNNKKTALAAAFVYAISPLVFYFDLMALADSMLSMFGIWTFILFYLTVKKERLDLAMLAGFSLGFAWLTKSPALFFALMLPTVWLFAKNVKSLKKVIPLTFVTVIIGYSMYNILRLGANFHMIAIRNLDYVYPISHLFTSPFDPLKPFILQCWQWLVLMGPWPILVLAFLGITINTKQKWKSVFVLLIWFLAPVLAECEYAKVLTVRYILFCIPFLIVLASSAFNLNSKKKVYLYFSSLAALVFVFLGLYFDYLLITNPQKAQLPRSERTGYLEDWSSGYGIKEAADYIHSYQEANPDKKIVVGTEGYFGTLPDGLMAYLNNDRKITIIGVGLNFSDIPTPLVESQKSGNATFLIINDSRFKGVVDGKKLKLIAKYPKAIRPDGSYESLLVLMLQ